MSASIICRVIIDGKQCGYEPPLDLSPRDRVIDLLRHRDTHLPQAQREPVIPSE